MNDYIVWYYNEYTDKNVNQRISAKSEKKAKEMFFKTHKDDELTMDDLHAELVPKSASFVCAVYNGNICVYGDKGQVQVINP